MKAKLKDLILAKIPLLRSEMEPIWAFGRHFGKDMAKFDLFKQASAMAYATLLSIIPSLALCFSLISSFTHIDKGNVVSDWLKQTILSSLTDASGKEVAFYVENFLRNLDLTQMGVSSIVGFMVTFIVLLRQIELVFNRIWEVDSERNLVTRFIYFWTFITLGTFLASVLFSLVFEFRPKGGLTDGLFRISAPGWTTSFGLSFIFFFFIYKIVPNCTVKTSSSAVGAFFTTIVFILARKSFVFYISSIAKYDSLYGALAALPLFLIWLYVCWLVVLFGAVLTWRLDTKVEIEGEQKPILDLETTPFETEPLKQMRLKSLVPFFLLCVVYKRSLQGTFTGVRGADLIKNLSLPYSWAQEGMHFLQQLGYIVVVREGEGGRSIFEQLYFPSHQANRVPLEQIFNELIEPFERCLEQWQQNMQYNFAALLQTSVKMHLAKEDKSLEDLLNNWS